MAILITGNHGFIGCWLNIFIKEIDDNKIYGIDNRSSYGERLIDLKEGSNNIVEKQFFNNVSDTDKLIEILNENNINQIFHISGQAIVPRAFIDPGLTFDSNVMSTFSVLEASRRAHYVEKICIITSDKVYKNENKNKRFSENDVLAGKDIYSTSKVICEHLAECYKKIHFDQSKIVEVVRLGNVVGGGDYSVNRLLPDLIRSYLNKNTFEVRYPQATRPFQHVVDVVNGIYSILMNNIKHDEENYLGDCWNLGPKNNTVMVVEDVIKLFTKVFHIDDIKPRKNSLPEDILLAVDNTKYTEIFGNPNFDSSEAIIKAIEWYKKVHQEKKSPWDLTLKEVKSFLKFR
tara:strand:+ start:7404 stop:8441 length:1038 start_codon:yes stop_codon:yes gene_type:complete